MLLFSAIDILHTVELSVDLTGRIADLRGTARRHYNNVPICRVIAAGACGLCAQYGDFTDCIGDARDVWSGILVLSLIYCPMSLLVYTIQAAEDNNQRHIAPVEHRPTALDMRARIRLGKIDHIYIACLDVLSDNNDSPTDPSNTPVSAFSVRHGLRQPTVSEGKVTIAAHGIRGGTGSCNCR